MVNVTWKSTWVDPGATAFDAVDGDCTSSIQSFGVGAVDTSVPTPPGKTFSYVVEYAVSDKSNNAAPTARRLIRVVCPGAENYCIDPDTSKPGCTSKGVCGAPALLSSSASTTTGAGASSSGASASVTSAGTGAGVMPAAPAPPSPPNISLLLPGPVQISAGSVYDRCADAASITDVCERGVAALDAQDGNLERQVLVCGNRCVLRRE